MGRGAVMYGAPVPWNMTCVTILDPSVLYREWARRRIYHSVCLCQTFLGNSPVSRDD